MASPLDDDFPMQMEREAGAPENCPMLAVGFGLHPMVDKAKSDAAGHEVYVDIEHVKIAVPGDRSSLYFQPATDVYRKRFPKAYAAYKSRDTKPTEGLPIDQWAAVSRAQALTLKAANVSTVEAMAQVHEGLIDKLPGGRELKAKAIAFLEQAKGSAAVLKAASENQKLQDQLASLQAQIIALGAKPAAIEASPVAADDIEPDVIAARRRKTA